MKMGEKLPNTSSDHVALPLLDGGGDGGGGGGGGGGRRYWLVDVEECKTQILFSLPMILSNVFCYLIPLVSVMFAGHLGQLQLAAATLANSWCFVTGFAFMMGLSGALETLCGQSFGAKSYKMLGIYLQASCITSFLFSTIIGSLWFYTEHILIFLHQDPEISRTAGVYMKFLIPGLFAYGFQQNILRFFQTQSEVMPLIVLSGVPLCAHIGVSYALVHCTNLGFKGAPIAASISLWLSTIVLVVHVFFSKQFKHTWNGFTFESFRYVLTNMKLALSSAAMVCLEDCAFELLVLMAGMMPNPGLTTSLIALCVNTEAIAYMGTYGLSATVSTRVSNELGAGNPDKAKKATVMTVKLSLLLAIVIVLALSFGNNIWAGCYSNSAPIIEAFASMTPLLAISITLDAIQGILSGVARGCGWQDLAVIANLATFYCIGMPAATILGFKFKLYAKGLWIGLICGLSCQACALLLITLSKKWTRLDMLDDRSKQNSELA